MPKLIKTKSRRRAKAPVNVHDAKTHFAKLLNRVRLGEDVVIARAGKPIARLVPVEQEHQGPRVLGAAVGKIWFSDDIDKPWPDDFIDLFYNSSALEPGKIKK